MVYALAVLAALFVGTGTAIEQRGCTSVGNVVFATALGVGSVAVVEAVYILRLLFALTVSAAWGRHRVPVRDGAGALVLGVGLTGFLVAARPSEGVVHEVSGLAWALFGGSVVVVALALAVLAKQASPVRKAVLLGLAAGSLFALQASNAWRSCTPTSGATGTSSTSGPRGRTVTERAS